MISLKSIFQPSFFNLSNNTSTITTLHHHHHNQNNKRRTNNVFVCLCTNSRDESDSKPEGDVQSQELLAQIVMLQTEKVRLRDYLDERSEYLTQFGEDAKAEIDKIGEDALKGLDEASDRITAKIESQMLEFEESNELNKIETEESESKVMEIEGQMEVDRNEGLFFKNLGQKGPNVDKAKAKEEVENIKTREKNGKKTRKNVYLFFIGLLTYGIVGSINVSSLSTTDWKKTGALAVILVVLFSQFIYEQNKENNQNDEQ